MEPDFGWINLHISDNPSKLRLKYGAERAFDILQIEMRRRHASKFAETFAGNPEFVFPNSLSAEQATSDRLADFHFSLIDPGANVADLTAGLGIDAMALAKVAGSVVAVEHDPEVAAALRYNSRRLTNFTVIEDDCRHLLQSWVKEARRFDAIFIDPARRDTNGGRVFALKDCEPDVVAMLPVMAEVTDRIIVKASPMLDITHTVNALSPFVEEVVVLGTTTECKELDLLCNLKKRKNSQPEIRAVTVGSDFQSEFDFTRSEETQATPIFGVPKVEDFILNPYPAVMKAAPVRLLGQSFGVKKIGSNTHLWFSEKPAENFPGTAFRVLEVLPYMSKHIKRYAERWPRTGVTARNFDISSENLRAKLKVTDGPLRLFAVNAFDGRKLLITCEKI